MRFVVLAIGLVLCALCAAAERVAHVGSRMVESPCGVAAAFDVGRCATE
jgi:hypothetical protein